MAFVIDWEEVQWAVEAIGDHTASKIKMPTDENSHAVTVYKTESCIRIDIHTSKEHK